jgi:hypothetical protein
MVGIGYAVDQEPAIFGVLVLGPAITGVTELAFGAHDQAISRALR